MSVHLHPINLQLIATTSYKSKYLWNQRKTCLLVKYLAADLTFMFSCAEEIQIRAQHRRIDRVFKRLTVRFSWTWIRSTCLRYPQSTIRATCLNALSTLAVSSVVTMSMQRTLFSTIWKASFLKWTQWPRPWNSKQLSLKLASSVANNKTCFFSHLSSTTQLILAMR